MQLLREQPATGETVDSDHGTARKGADDQPTNSELGGSVAASESPAVSSTLAVEALTPLPRARSLVVVSDTGPSRPDLATGTPDHPSVTVSNVAEAHSPSVANPPRLRTRREFNNLSKADETVLFPEKFRHDMLWLDIWGLPLPFLAFTLALREDVDVTCPEVREAIARVSCVEGGTWSKGAQARLTPTVSAFGPQKPKLKRKGGRRGPEREPDWSTSNPFVWSLLLEEAANRYVAGTFTPTDET